jgi:hypothetical protein
MEKLWEATLNDKSPRYADWLAILGSSKVPLKSTTSFECRLGETGRDRVYALDLADLSVPQHDRLVKFICMKSGLNRPEVLDELIKKGFPIRTSDVVLTFSLRAFL